MILNNGSYNPLKSGEGELIGFEHGVEIISLSKKPFKLTFVVIKQYQKRTLKESVTHQNNDRDHRQKYI